MNIPSIISTSSLNLLSGLANNDSSIASMVVKDTISNAAIVHTYKKEGGKDDAREKAIEEFGTGAIWLFGIPTVKAIMDKTIYPLLGISSKIDPRILNDKEKLSQIKQSLESSSNEFLSKEKEIFKNLESKAGLYKGAHVAKFAISTVLSAIALKKIIEYKQKTTQRRIQKDYYNNNASKILINKQKNENIAFSAFCPQKKAKNVSFGGLGAALGDFMYNPIKNTSILDCVITGTRLKEARRGERKEVALKEAFQIFFIYCLAKPIQKGFEFVGKKINRPIELDPKVLFSKNLKQDINASKPAIESLLNSNNILKDIYSLDVKNPLVSLLDKNGVISTLKGKNGEINAISYLKTPDESAVKSTLKNLLSLNGKIENLKSIKAFKTLAVLGNVALAAWAMGVLQPKVAIGMRKLLNHGDNRNPAIVEQERKMNLEAHQG